MIHYYNDPSIQYSITHYQSKKKLHCRRVAPTDYLASSLASRVSSRRFQDGLYSTL